MGSRQLLTPDVLGDVHSIFSCNSLAKDCGPAVGISRSAPNLGAGLCGRPSEVSTASRTLVLFLITYKKTSWWAESRVECRLA